MRGSVSLFLLFLVCGIGVASATSVPIPPTPPTNPSDTNDWEGLALGTSTVGPGTSGGATGALGFVLLNRFNPDDIGFSEASIPPGAGGSSASAAAELPIPFAKFVFGQSILVLSVPAVKANGLPGKATVTLDIGLNYRGNLGLVNPSCKAPHCTEVISIGGGFGQDVGAVVDDSYTAEVAVHAEAPTMGNVDQSSAKDGPHSGGATISQTADIGGPGKQTSAPLYLGTEWGIFSDTVVQIDGGAPMSLFSTEFARNNDGTVTADNLITDLANGPLMLGSFTASGSFADTMTFGPGTHTLVFQDELWGFLDSQTIGTPEPESFTFTVAGLGLFALLATIQRARRRRV